MVQEFHVLKCYSCDLYQVHIVKKVNKWNCKVCNAKQSIIKVFNQGSAKDCRSLVQKLNELSRNRDKNERVLENEHIVNSTSFNEEFNSNTENECNMRIEEKSKWKKFLEPQNENESIELEKSSTRVMNEFSEISSDFKYSSCLNKNSENVLPLRSSDNEVTNKRSTSCASMKERKSKKMFRFSSNIDESNVDLVLDL